MELKVGDWATDEWGDTFLILKIDEWCIPMSTHSEMAYYDIYHGAHITYLCKPAKREDIERVCAEMLDLQFRT